MASVRRRARAACARLLLVGAAMLLVIGCAERSSTREPAGRPPSERLQGTLDRVRREQGIPGAAAAVVMPGGRVWVGVSGLADVQKREPVRPETLFEVASVTKPFVAALVLALADDGVLGLDDRLSRWVPEFPGSRRITLRELLNHTAGNSDYVGDGRFLAAQRRRGIGAVWTPRQLLRYVPEPLAAPGERWHYSNANYLLLGLAIERATGSTVGRELHRRVLPDQVVFQGEQRPRGAVAVGYMDLDADPELEPTPNNPYVPTTSEATSAWASGNLLAGAEDIARAGHRLFGGDLLSARSRREMTRWVDATFEPPEYGLGVARDELAGEEAWGHSGDISGFHAELWHLPKLRTTVAALTNHQAGPDDRGKQRLVEELIGGIGAP